MKPAIPLILLLIMVPLALAQETLTPIQDDQSAAFLSPADKAKYLTAESIAKDPQSAMYIIKSLDSSNIQSTPAIRDGLRNAYAANPLYMNENMQLASSFFSNPDTTYSGSSLGEYMKRSGRGFAFTDTGDPSRVKPRSITDGEPPEQLVLKTANGDMVLDLNSMPAGSKIFVNNEQGTFKVCGPQESCTEANAVELSQDFLKSGPQGARNPKGNVVQLTSEGRLDVLLDGRYVASFDPTTVKVINKVESGTDRDGVFATMANGDAITLIGKRDSEGRPIGQPPDVKSGPDGAQVTLGYGQDVFITRQGKLNTFSGVADSRAEAVVTLAPILRATGKYFDISYIPGDASSAANDQVHVNTGESAVTVRLNDPGTPAPGDIVVGPGDLPTINMANAAGTTVKYFEKGDRLVEVTGTKESVVTLDTKAPHASTVFTADVKPDAPLPVEKLFDGTTYVMKPGIDGAVPELSLDSPAAALAPTSGTPTIKKEAPTIEAITTGTPAPTAEADITKALEGHTLENGETRWVETATGAQYLVQGQTDGSFKIVERAVSQGSSKAAITTAANAPAAKAIQALSAMTTAGAELFRDTISGLGGATLDLAALIPTAPVVNPVAFVDPDTVKKPTLAGGTNTGADSTATSAFFGGAGARVTNLVQQPGAAASTTPEAAPEQALPTAGAGRGPTAEELAAAAASVTPVSTTKSTTGTADDVAVLRAQVQLMTLQLKVEDLGGQIDALALKKANYYPEYGPGASNEENPNAWTKADDKKLKDLQSQVKVAAVDYDTLKNSGATFATALAAAAGAPAQPATPPVATMQPPVTSTGAPPAATPDANLQPAAAAEAARAEAAAAAGAQAAAATAARPSVTASPLAPTAAGTAPAETVTVPADVPATTITGTRGATFLEPSVQTSKAYTTMYNSESQSNQVLLDNAVDLVNRGQADWPARDGDGRPVPITIPAEYQPLLASAGDLLFVNKGVNLKDPQLTLAAPVFGRIDADPTSTLKFPSQVGIIIKTNQPGKVLVVPGNDDFKLSKYYAILQGIKSSQK